MPRHKQRRGPMNPLASMKPLPFEELPSQLNTKRWRRGEEGWEDRPAAVNDPNASVLFRAPVSVFDVAETMPISDLAVESE